MSIEIRLSELNGVTVTARLTGDKDEFLILHTHHHSRPGGASMRMDARELLEGIQYLRSNSSKVRKAEKK